MRGTWIAASVLLYAMDAHADLSYQILSHRRSLLPGDKAAMMGGAYTALSDDPSGIHYNPAGMAWIEGSEASMNGLFSELHSKIVFKGALLGNDFREESQTRFAGLSGGIWNLGRLSVGYGILTLDNKNINQNDAFPNLAANSGAHGSYYRIHQERSVFDLYGGGAALKLGNHVSIGVSAFYGSRVVEIMDYQLSRVEDGATDVHTTKTKANNAVLLPGAGITWRGRNFSAGAAASKGVSVSDTGTLDIQDVSFDPATGEPRLATATASTGFLAEINPLTVQGGVAWHPGKNFVLSGDILFHKAEKGTSEQPSLRNTFNGSLGFALKLAMVRILGGVFTNNSMFPEPTSGGLNQLAHIDYIGYSGGISLETREYMASAGVIAQVGKGTAQIMRDNPAFQDVTGTMTHLFAGVGYRFR